MDLWQHQLELAVWLVHVACNQFLILPQLYQELSPAPPEKIHIQIYSFHFCPPNIKITYIKWKMVQSSITQVSVSGINKILFLS